MHLIRNYSCVTLIQNHKFSKILGWSESLYLVTHMVFALACFNFT